MKLNIHIDRVIVDRPMSREELIGAIETGMAASIAEGGLPQALGSPSMRPAGAAAEGAGGIGGAIYRSLGT